MNNSNKLDKDKIKPNSSKKISQTSNKTRDTLFALQNFILFASLATTIFFLDNIFLKIAISILSVALSIIIIVKTGTRFFEKPNLNKKQIAFYLLYIILITLLLGLSLTNSLT